MTDPVRQWRATDQLIAESNIGWLMRKVGVSSYDELQAWTAANRAAFWSIVMERIGVRLRHPYTQILDISNGTQHAQWFLEARLNIADSCFQAEPDSLAIVEHHENGRRRVISVAELDQLSNRVASALVAAGIDPGDCLGMVLPMSIESVATYLGIIKAGAAVVGIADSFSPEEIGTRLRISQARYVVTQDFVIRGGKKHELYSRVRASGTTPAIVLAALDELGVTLAANDLAWSEFIEADNRFTPVARGTDDVLNVLFSSGTTGDPKAIPWTHLCPIKCAMDGHFHHDLRPGDVVAWPTSHGWMMGPWLIFASLMNRATMALFIGSPNSSEFGGFVEEAGVTMLGVIPSLVATWRSNGTIDGCDWTSIRVFSSTGECSNPDDMWWLMQHAGGRPVIEYCGGTELSGGYIAGTIARPCVPGMFNTPALGLDFLILDEAGNRSSKGELFLIPPSIGMSTRLLNGDHHEIYYADCPTGPKGEPLRRHGDEMESADGGYWQAHGRADDTMNLGGIKVSSAEIERVVSRATGVREAAAVARPTPGGGPSQLVIFVVPDGNSVIDELRKQMQTLLRRDLNPLFKIHDVIVVDAMPRTASNKIMRRMLRARSVTPAS